MKRTLYILLISVVFVVACTPNDIIPRGKMADIYYDFYMADRYLESMSQFKLGDSVQIYIPIIEKHGYTFDEYRATVDYYLHKPEELTKIFKMTETKVKQRRDYLEEIISQTKEKNKKWKLLDSLDIYGDDNFKGNGHYRALRILFFKPDTLEITSPTLDSTILNHISSAYFLYDSIPGLYDRIPMIKLKEERQDTIRLVQGTKSVQIKKEPEKILERPAPSPAEETDEEEARLNSRLRRFSNDRSDE
ncbi:MAG: DUF4296 domain-containing protein [Bacteroidales bacterium]|nr:DUF4296 domain-containing protein [Bacteroidales bacterium]